MADFKTALTTYLTALVKAEKLVATWQEAVFQSGVMGKATCEDIQAYNKFALQVFNEETAVLNDVRTKAQADPIVGQWTLALLPLQPRDPVLFGFSTPFSAGHPVLNFDACPGSVSPKVPLDPKILRRFGTPPPFPCGEAGGDGATLQGPGLLVGLCEPPFALLGCVLLAAVLLNGATWSVSTTLSSLAKTYSAGARNLEIATKNNEILAKRQAYIAKCQGSFADCTAQALKLYPLIPYEKGFFEGFGGAVTALALGAVAVFGIYALIKWLPSPKEKDEREKGKIKARLEHARERRRLRSRPYRPLPA